MILVDMNQCMISNLMVQVKTSNGLDENLVRHMVLNSLRNYRKKFGGEYVMSESSTHPLMWCVVQ